MAPGWGPPPGWNLGSGPHRGPGWGPHARRRWLRHSLRRRLAWAFLAVAGISWLVAYVAPRALAHTGGRHPAPFPVLFLALGVAAVVGAITADRITGSLSRLRDAVERIDLRDLSPRVPIEGRDEVASLARAFNGMADRIAAEERVRRQLFADVAHELHHPLAVLKGRLDMMQDGSAPIDAEQVLRLQDGVIALTSLVSDLRDLSLAEVGQLSLNIAAVDVAALIADLRENLEPVAADRGVTLAADVAVGVGTATADPDRLRQVLVNLLANALQHTPAGGRVDVRASSAGGQVVVEVADTGSGISADDLAHIFDRFYRTDQSRSRDTGGSGLGLAIVRSLVTLQGGTVDVTSEVGAGTRFRVTLPAAG